MLLVKPVFLAFGLQILLLLNPTESMVVLTANVEDIKRIANKVVSQAMANKIVDFIVQLPNMNKLKKKLDISKENEKNVKSIQEVSDTDTKVFLSEVESNAASRIKKSFQKESDTVKKADNSRTFETPPPPKIRFMKKTKTKKRALTKRTVATTTTKLTSKTTEGSWFKFFNQPEIEAPKKNRHHTKQAVRHKIIKKAKESREERTATERSKSKHRSRPIKASDSSKSSEIEESPNLKNISVNVHNTRSEPVMRYDGFNVAKESVFKGAVKNVEDDAENKNNTSVKLEEDKEAIYNNLKESVEDGVKMRKSLVKNERHIVGTSGPLLLPNRRSVSEWWEKPFTAHDNSTTIKVP